jgi:hypothetical protein
MREVLGAPTGVAGAGAAWDVLERGVEGTARVDMTVVVRLTFARERERGYTQMYRKEVKKNDARSEDRTHDLRIG